MKERLFRQLAIDYCCSYDDIIDHKNHFTKFVKQEGRRRFDEAFCFDEATPDMLAVAAVMDGEIVGMAGASADSPLLWQIGINVSQKAEGRHIGSTLVSILKHDIMEMGITPYYGTSFSNLASQKVAANAGFEVMWVELLSEKDNP